MKKVICCILLFLLSMPLVFAQQKDSLTQAPTSKNDSLKEKKHLKFYLGFDSRHSFIYDENGKIFGLRIGMSYGNKFRFGIGFYNLTKPIILQKNFITNDTLTMPNGGTSIVPDTGKVVANFNYSTLFYEPILLHKKRWEISLPLMVGIGTIRTSSLNNEGKLLAADTLSPLLLEMDITGYYKIFPWIGLGAGAGYRIVMTKDKAINKAYSSPLYIFKVKIFISYIYRLVFPKKKKD